MKSIFRNWVWSLSKKEKTIYLTFDDGPTPKITEWTLNLLKKYKANATYFCIGKNIVEHPAIFQRILKNGNAVGNHTNNHLNGWKTNSKLYVENCIKATKTMQQFNNSKLKTVTLSGVEGQNLKLKPVTLSGVEGQNSKLFRPPYGKLTFKQSKKIRKKGYKIIMWDVLSGDFDATISKEKCLENVLKNTKNGSIIVFHDSVKASEKLKYVLPKVLEYYTEKGYGFKKIT